MPIKKETETKLIEAIEKFKTKVVVRNNEINIEGIKIPLPQGSNINRYDTIK